MIPQHTPIGWCMMILHTTPNRLVYDVSPPNPPVWRMMIPHQTYMLMYDDLNRLMYHVRPHPTPHRLMYDNRPSHPAYVVWCVPTLPGIFWCMMIFHLTPHMLTHDAPPLHCPLSAQAIRVLSAQVIPDLSAQVILLPSAQVVLDFA